MKRVTIVTWCGGANYGTSLQAFALERSLKTLGFEARTLLYVPIHKGILLRAFEFPIRVFRKLMRMAGIRRRSNVAQSGHEEFFAGRHASVRQWMSDNMTTIMARDRRDVDRIVEETDCFISGSDQIWNSYATFIPMMYLNFAGRKKRISYASSVGAQSINPRYARQIRKWLRRYQHISVREECSIGVLCRLVGNQEIVSVVDPTLLLNAGEWRSLMSNRYVAKEEKYLLCYILGSRTRPEQISEVAEHYGIRKIVVVPAKENPSFTIDGATIVNEANPFEFVGLIANATMVCTDSFHGLAFSINLSRPFVAFLRFEDGDSKSQNPRIYNLLSRYDLEDRLCSRSWRDSSSLNARSCTMLETDRERCRAILERFVKE